MGEKHGTRTRGGARTRTILEALAPLPTTAKVADLIPVINALLLALAPGKPTEGVTLPAAVDAKVKPKPIA